MLLQQRQHLHMVVAPGAHLSTKSKGTLSNRIHPENGSFQIALSLPISTVHAESEKLCYKDRYYVNPMAIVRRARALCSLAMHGTAAHRCCMEVPAWKCTLCLCQNESHYAKTIHRSFTVEYKLNCSLQLGQPLLQ